MQYKESPVICGIRVYPLKKPDFSMVHYSVNQAIMTKKVSLKYKILCLRSVTSTIHTSHLEYMYIQVVLLSPIQAAIRMFRISPLKMNNKFQGFHTTCI